MPDTLLHVVSRYAEAFADPSGQAKTPVRGLSVYRSTAPTGLVHAISCPMACFVVQGTKQVSVGAQTVTFSTGDSIVVTGDVPCVSQIIGATPEQPYLSMVLELDLALIADLTLEMKAVPAAEATLVRVEPTEDEVADVALRLMRLLERPASLPILHAQLLRELHYWLLAGKHGPALRRLGGPQGHVQRIARAIAVLRTDFSRPLPVERLAAEAGMSPSSFHQHFRAATSLSPLQFQKQLRLIEARRLIMAEGRSASSAAFAVGYESVSQFTREYARMFGLPPIRDTAAVRRLAEAA